MSIKEKVAYIEGLAEGLEIAGSENGKIMMAIIDVLGDIAVEIEELNENALDIGEELDAISDDLAEVEDFLLDDDDDERDLWDIVGADDYDDDDDDFDDYDDDDDFDDDIRNHGGCGSCGKNHNEDDVEFTIDINCPECDTELELDDEDIANESVTCPICGKLIELEIDEIDTDEDGEFN